MLERTINNQRVEEEIVGNSPAFLNVLNQVRIIAKSDSVTLIQGETGTGKEVIARAIHNHSLRSGGPFVKLNCAAIPSTLLESELFGHERGAFTGAWTDRRGRFELARGGTLFLDDVDAVPMAVQVKLLRALQNRTIERVGGTCQVPIDVRVITGSQRPLRAMVAEGTFRADLYYRLDVMSLWLPPLRQRREDIPLLTDHFMRRFFGKHAVPDLSANVRAAFQRYSWPGNVRELEHACERIAQTCTCRKVRCGCTPASILFQARAAEPETAPQSGRPSTAAGISLDGHLQQVESRLIDWALTASRGNKSRAAELLLVKRSTLCDRIRKLQRNSGSDRQARSENRRLS